MNEISQSLVIRIGADPRSFPEFSALREEINKINRPSQPEVNWRLIESLALTLFRNNGVDLQTAIYYTLARTQLNSLSGFTEGCELLAGVIVGQWDELWPDKPQAKVEILEWFNTRVGNQLRQQSFSSDDLRLVYRAERALQLLCDKLQQVELKRLPRIDNLLYLMQNTAKRLEGIKETAPMFPQENPLQMPPMVYLSHSDSSRVAGRSAEQLQQQQQDDQRAKVHVHFPPLSQKKLSAIHGFVLGVGCMLLVGAGFYLLQMKPLQQQLAAIAQEKEGAVLLWLHQPELESYATQLDNLAKHSPLATLDRARQLVNKAKEIWPEHPQQIAESQRWIRLYQTRIEEQHYGGYHHLQQKLHTLSDKLLEQERVKGGITISYLKTAVYQMQEVLNQDVPLEELLRRLALTVKQGGSAPPTLLQQIDERWEVLVSQYHQLVKQAEQ